MSAVTVLSKERGEVLADRRLSLAFLGCGKRDPDPALSALLEQAEERITPILTCRACAVRLPIMQENGGLSLGGIVLPGEAIARHLAGCREAFLFAATVGIEVDRLLTKLSHLSAAELAVSDAVASSAIEVWCDTAEAEFLLGCPHRSRFSPGYGDFPLSVQSALLDRLDAARTIGLCTTGSLLLTPTKSVTAIIGIEAAFDAAERKRR